MTHKLKTMPVFYDDVEVGAKCFDIRKNDRNFKVGDILHLLKFIPETGKFTGESVMVRVKYTICLDNVPGMPGGFIGMGIELMLDNADSKKPCEFCGCVDYHKSLCIHIPCT